MNNQKYDTIYKRRVRYDVCFNVSDSPAIRELIADMMIDAQLEATEENAKALLIALLESETADDESGPTE